MLLQLESISLSMYSRHCVSVSFMWNRSRRAVLTGYLNSEDATGADLRVLRSSSDTVFAFSGAVGLAGFAEMPVKHGNVDSANYFS